MLRPDRSKDQSHTDSTNGSGDDLPKYKCWYMQSLMNSLGRGTRGRPKTSDHTRATDWTDWPQLRSYRSYVESRLWPLSRNGTGANASFRNTKNGSLVSEFAGLDQVLQRHGKAQKEEGKGEDRRLTCRRKIWCASCRPASPLYGAFHGMSGGVVLETSKVATGTNK